MEKPAVCLLIFRSDVLFPLDALMRTRPTCQTQRRWWAAAPASPGHGWCTSPWQPVAGRRGGRGWVIRWRSASAPPPLCAPAWSFRAAQRRHAVTWLRPEQPSLQKGREELQLFTCCWTACYYRLNRLKSHPARWEWWQRRSSAACTRPWAVCSAPPAGQRAGGRGLPTPGEGKGSLKRPLPDTPSLFCCTAAGKDLTTGGQRLVSTNL